MIIVIFAVLFCGCFEIAWGMINFDIMAMVSGMSFCAIGLCMLSGYIIDDDDNNDDLSQ